MQEGGKSKPMTKQRALIKRLLAGALGGNTALIKLTATILGKLPIKIEELEKALSADDAKILQDYIERKTRHE